MRLPYSYFSCSCIEEERTAVDATAHGDDDEEQEKAFNPRNPRSNFSLYPLDHLMWCEDCHDVRCPRCTVEEIVCWYCPSCLFEVPSSTVRSDGNRCTRNCFNCPECTANLSVISLDPEPSSSSSTGPYILACEYCNWTSLDIGLQFESPRYIYAQIQKIQQGRPIRTQSSLSLELEVDDTDKDTPESRRTHHQDSRFALLRSFYSSQLSKSNPDTGLMSPGGDINYNSPSSLARIMSLYTTSMTYGKRSVAKLPPMREASDASEGLRIFSPTSDASAIAKLRSAGWAGTTSASQRHAQPHNPHFCDELWPVASLLRTKRSKRCRACRHILVKPETKVSSTRYRIKLAALNYVPSMALRILPAASTPPLDFNALPPGKPLQFLLRVTNPMFDAVKVTLATPAVTPGRHGSKVTILCPQFEVGANTDVWDEALGAGGDARRAGKLAKPGTTDEVKVAEAGKIWDRGRNWTVVVLEVVGAMIGGTDDEGANDDDEDEDVMEVPIFVRCEYEVDVERDGAGGIGGKEDKEKRELAYWAVIGVGRLARSEGQMTPVA